MMRILRYVVIGIFGLIVVGAGVGIYLYNKPHQNIKIKKPDYIVEAQSLMTEYRLDEKQADKKYLGKILLISGEVKAIEKSANGSVSYSLEDAFFGITCTINEKDSKELITNKNEINTGDQVSFKGRCDGLLTDVRISDCILVEQTVQQ